MIGINNAAFLADMNALDGSNYVVLLEIEYEDGAFVRFARWDQVINFEGFNWQPFPIGPIEVSQTVQGEIPAFDILLSNVGREVMSILELYEVENRPGRLVWVLPELLTDPAAAVSEPFVVVSARADNTSASLTVAPVNFDPLALVVPNQVVTITDFPGVLGNRSRYLV